jgi:hypothetical protein
MKLKPVVFKRKRSTTTDTHMTWLVIGLICIMALCYAVSLIIGN